MIELSYAGVPLGDAMEYLASWSDNMLPADLDRIGPQPYPLTRLGGYGPRQKRRPRPGTLYWPSGCSRWAVGHFFAHRQQVEAIDNAVGMSQSSPGHSATLKIQGNDGESVSPSMFMLPPRPLAKVMGSLAEGKDLYLLTFVDDRYWWWSSIAPDGLLDEVTTWIEAVQAAVDALGITLGSSLTLSGTWGAFPSGVNFAGEPLPLVIDALAYATGLRFSRTVSGSNYLRNADDDRTADAANRNQNWAVWKGGLYQTDTSVSTLARHQPYALPEKARVAFIVDSDKSEVDTTINSALWSGVQSAGTRKGYVRSWIARRLSVDTAGDDGDYAEAFSREYAKRQVSTVETRYSGIKPWNPNGLNDCVEWVWRGNDDELSATVVRRGPFNDGIIELVGAVRSSATATNIKGLRIVGIDGGSGNPYATDSSIRYYLTSAQKFPPPPVPPDTDELIWLVPYYQTAIWGGVPDVYLDETRAYSGFDTGTTKALTVNVTEDNDNIGIETGSQELDLPVYWTFFSPPAMACDDDSPVIAPGTS